MSASFRPTDDIQPQDCQRVAHCAPALEAHLLGQIELDRALALQQRLIYEAGGRNGAPLTLLVCEHPPIITIGRAGSRAQILATSDELASRQIDVRWAGRGGGAILHAPGQVAVYPIVPLDALGWTVGDFLRRFLAGLVATLADLGLHAPAKANLDGIWGRSGQLAAIGAAVRHGITWHGAFINVAPAMYLQRLVAADRTGGCPLSSLVIERQQAVKITTVRSALVARLGESLGAERWHVYSGHPLLSSASSLQHGSFRRAV